VDVTVPSILMPRPSAVPVVLPGAVGSTVAIGEAWLRTDRRTEPVVVAIGGELDLSGSAALAGAMKSFLGSSRPRTLTVDLSELRFIDASGIRALLQIEDDASVQGCAVVLADPSATVTRVFEICGLADHLESENVLDLTSCDSSQLR
jgi:anti-anti-sigma factor